MKPHTSIVICIFLLLIPTCCADLGENMIEGGIKQTIISLANEIYSLSITDSADSSTMIMMAAYTMDPYKIPAVNDTNSIITDLFYCAFIIMIFGHAAIIVITQHRPEKLEGLDFVTIDFNGYHYSEYVTKMIKGICILALAHFGIQMVLEIEQWITIEMLQNIPGSIEPSPENTVLYAIMSLIWLSLLVFFIIRGYVILLFAAFALAVGAMYIWGTTEATAVMLWKYFLGLTFMQPIIVGVSCVVVRAVKESTGFSDGGQFNCLLDNSAEIVYYLGLMVILFIISFIIVFGPVLQVLLRIVVRKVIW